MNNFISSPVLREFYQTALKKGWVKDELEKQAASSEIKPVGDLDCDVVCLINNLKKRGMNSEASSLEKKFLIYKEAQFDANRLIDNESKNLLELAHASNTKIMDTQSGMGEIHTDLDRQRKIIETLNHQPNGNLLRSAAEVLGLIKTSQENFDSESLNPSELEISDPEQDEWEMSISDEDKKKVENINKTLNSNKKSLSSFLLQIINTINASKKSTDYFNKSAILSNSDLLKFYCEINNFKISDINNFIKIYNYWGGDSVTAENISNKLVGYNDYKALYSAMYNVVPANMFKVYFYGTKLTDFSWLEKDDEARAIKNEISRGNHQFLNNENSVWELNLGHISAPNFGLFSKDSDLTVSIDSLKLRGDKVEEFSQSLSSWIAEEYKKYFSEEFALNASTALFGELDKSIGELIKKSNVLAQNIPMVRRTTGLAVDPLIEIFKLCNKAYEELQSTTLTSLLPSVSKMISGMISGAIKITENILEFLEKNKLNIVLDSIISDAQITNWRNKVKTAYQMWNKYQTDNKLTDEQNSSISTFKNDLTKLFNMLKSISSLSFASFKSKFGEIFGKEVLKDSKTLDAYFSQILQNAIDMTGYMPKGSSSFKALSQLNPVDLFKASQVTAPKGFSPSTKPSVSNSKPINQQTVKKTDLTESGKAVQRMQLLLRNLASWLVSSSEKNVNDVNLLMRVGPETKDPTLFDGSWGPNTNKAVETASKYTQKYLQKKLELGPMMGKPEEEIKNKANTNSNLLAALLQKVGYAGLKELGISSNEVIYDKIHKGFNITTVEDLNGTIPLKTTDLSSLKSLYNFIKTNGIYTGIDDGITLKDWDDALKWLINRAMFKYKSAKNTKEIGLATAYYRNAVDLAYNFYGLVQKFNRSIQENPEIAIHPDDLEGSAGMGGKNFGFMPGGKLDKSKLQLISGPAGTNDPYSLQGQQKLVAQNPITRDYLFLNSDAPNGNPWFDPNLNYKAPLSKGIFNKNAVVVAQSLFGNLAGDESYMINTFLNQNPVFKLLSDSPNGPIVLDSRDQVRKYLNNIPEYQNAKLKLQNQLPILAYQMFLRNLINQLTTVYNKWIEVVGPVPQTAAQVQEYQQEWLQGINRHLNDLKEYAANRTLRPSRF